jgi:hypothetical protein
MPAGRPSDYSLEIVDTICARIAEGESLRAICRDADTPSMASIFKWLREHPEFAEQYTRAREQQAEAYADEIADIADNGEDVNRDRLRIDSRKWIASKLKPKKYGDKIQHGGDSDNPLSIMVVTGIDRKEG